MTNPIVYYKSKLNQYKASVSVIYKKLTTFSILRILTFIITAIGIYFTFYNWQVALLIGALGMVLFVFLLIKYSSLKKEHLINKALVAINEEELKISAGDFFNKSEGLEFQDAKHQYGLDIDLFGRGSFFQFIDRTQLKDSALYLANALKANQITGIIERQKAIKELASKPEWRQHFQATGSLIKVETTTEEVTKWLKNYKPFLPKSMKWLPIIVSICSITLIGLVIFKLIPSSLVGYWLLVGLFLTGRYVKKTNTLSTATDKIRDTFRQYALLLNAIENETFNSELLQQKQKTIQLKNEKASVVLKQLSRAMDALDNRNNIISALFGNGYFLTDLKHSYSIEKWIEKYGDTVDNWFNVAAFFDSYNSLGNYVFNHPNYVFPDILKAGEKTQVMQLGHPLLNKEKRIDNDFSIENQHFFIITGANMAGKSTFLRTVSLHIVMANMGLPVCATSSKYVPVKLITSMRTSDSLTDDSSYFFSELMRLKYIVETIETDSYFIILDEILKGTNSKDKAIGSRKFVEKLVAGNATGIIATHDLSLCEIENQLDPVKNYYFDAQIINDELFFDYRFKKGVCKNMNASFLLKKMEIV